MKFVPLTLSVATAALALVQIGSTTASAYSPPKLRTCPDGTVVIFSKPCPPTGPKAAFKPQLPSAASQNFAPNSGGTTKGKAPKPGDSTKDWRDYILGNPKPPIRPKP